jgi:hypothetical protein
MADCYHPDATFSDPVFGELKGEQVTSMWHMLVGRANDLKIAFRDVQADDTTGSAHWEAHYTFGKTQNKVHNIIDATFRFQDGLIIEHHDTFNFHRWATQALGLPGRLLGWTPFIRSKVRTTVLAQLATFMSTPKEE